MKTVGLLMCVGVAMFLTELPSWSQSRPVILIVVPEEDSTTTASSVYRLSASATPNSRVTLNGQPQFVYPSGAFCGLLPLTIGENRFTVVATSRDSVKAERSFVIVRKPPSEPAHLDTLAIDSVQMRPAQDRWLDTGQLLEVECKGTPGCKATFLDGVPMMEIGADGEKGGKGVYRGIYRVGEGDHLLNTPITFRLEDSAGHVVERSTTARVSFRSSDFPLVGVTRGERALLYYGLGDDRLGGAVLQRLVPGVRLAINGKTGTMYRVALGEREEAWIDEESLSLLPQGTYPPYSLTGNWNVYGDSLYDYVTVAMNDRLPYVSNPDMEPGRIIVDVFGAVANTNWIIQTLTTREVTNVSYRENGSGVMRMTINLRHKQLWGYSIAYRGTMLVIRIRRQPEHLRIKGLRFIVDAGHGGDNNGALGSTGAKEKDINLSTALHLKELLEDRGATVVLTRGADSSVSMASRLAVATRDQADMLISVHANSIGYTTNPADVRGVSTYYKYLAFRPLSLCILQRILGLDLPATGNVGSFNFYLNSVTEIPSVLVEQAYMSNPLDEMKLMNDNFRKDLARAIVKGIQDFLDGCEE